HYSFAILGALGLVWAFFWYVMYRDPAEHTGANDLERQYITDNGGRTDATDDAEAVKIRWIDLFRYRTIWGMMIGFFCLNFVIYFF
ncbi:MFS transporter, partial [Escherichia coli]